MTVQRIYRSVLHRDMSNWSIRLQTDDKGVYVKQVSTWKNCFFLNTVMGFYEHFHDYGSWEFSMLWCANFNGCELWVCMQTAFKLACVAKRFLSLANLVSICRSCQWRLTQCHNWSAVPQTVLKVHADGMQPDLEHVWVVSQPALYLYNKVAVETKINK